MIALWVVCPPSVSLSLSHIHVHAHACIYYSAQLFTNFYVKSNEVIFNISVFDGVSNVGDVILIYKLIWISLSQLSLGENNTNRNMGGNYITRKIWVEPKFERKKAKFLRFFILDLKHTHIHTGEILGLCVCVCEGSKQPSLWLRHGSHFRRWN